LEGERPIVFFDGVCGLCNHFVSFILSRDRRGVFLLAPLQGTTAADRLDLPAGSAIDSVVLLDDERTYQKSSAVVRILWQLGIGWRILAALLWLVPLPLRNVGYVIVARLRYRLFGKKEVCRMPTPQERERFLD
jgi:predicted DCC family thiol-disulfide oxidoreductase YuxK